MESVLSWGLDVIRSVQLIETPALTAIMRFLTLAGSEYFYLLLLPIVLWCIDEKIGLRLGLIVLFSSFVNLWLKEVFYGAFKQLRPYQVDPSLGLSIETTYSLPSGHAQGSATLWGFLASHIKKPWGFILAIFIPLLIGFTRVYLGVHYPSDVFAGWVLGFGIVLLWIVFGYRVEKFISKASLRVQIILAAVLTLGMNALNMNETSIPGVFFGTALGAAIMFSRVKFSARPGKLGQKLARLAIGLAGLGIVYFLGKLISPEKGESLYAMARFVRYGLLGVWVSLGAPWIFLRLKLAEKTGAAL